MTENQVRAKSTNEALGHARKLRTNTLSVLAEGPSQHEAVRLLTLSVLGEGTAN
jgi:hypothetical protein